MPSPAEPTGHPETGAWSNSSKEAWLGRSSEETGRQRKRQRHEVLLESCLRSVRHARGDRGHEHAPGPGGLDASPGDVRNRRRALKRIIDDALVEEAAARRKVHVARVRRDSVVGTSASPSSGRPSGGFGSGEGLDGGGQRVRAGFHGQPPYREDQQQLHWQQQRPRQGLYPQDDGELCLTDEEYLEMILRLEEELYQGFPGVGERDDQQSWDEMEDMDAAEIDAMVEAHLGEGSANGNGCLSTGGIQDAVSCPVCRQASLQVHPGNPYLFFCPGSMSMASMASGSTHGRDAGGPWPPGSLHPDVLLHSSHCAMDLSSEGIGLDRVGVRVRQCEHAHEAARPGCGGVVRFEMREGTGCTDDLGVPGVPGMPRMMLAVCDGCGWAEVCL